MASRVRSVEPMFSTARRKFEPLVSGWPRHLAPRDLLVAQARTSLMRG